MSSTLDIQTVRRIKNVRTHTLMWAGQDVKKKNVDTVYSCVEFGRLVLSGQWCRCVCNARYKKEKNRSIRCKKLRTSIKYMGEYSE